MRDPQRIDVMLKKIETIWKVQPDLRLCQLIGNMYPASDLYHKEDDDLNDRLDMYLKRLNNNRNVTNE